MKKLVSLALAAALTVSLAACSTIPKTSATTAAAPETTAAASMADETMPMSEEESKMAAETSMTMVEGSAANEDPLGVSTASIHFKAGITNAMTGAYAAGLVAFRKHLEEMSGGDMTVDIYPSSALGNESDMLDAVSTGTQDMLVTSTGPIPAFASATSNWAVLDLPYLFPTYETAYEVLDGEVGQSLLKGFDGTGVKALGFFENGYRCTTNSKKEIIHPSDLKGMKIRTMENKVHMATYAALGATPTAMAMGEVFSALQQKTIDGQENPFSIIYYGNKLHEVQAYMTENNVFYSPAVLCISQDVFDGLTAEQQEWVMESAKLARDEQRKVQRSMAVQARKDMEVYGIIISDVDQSEWIEATKSVYNDSSLGIDKDLLMKIQAVTGG